MTPILPLIELEVKDKGDLDIYSKVQNINGFVLNLYSPCVGFDTEFLILTHDKSR